MRSVLLLDPARKAAAFSVLVHVYIGLCETAAEPKFVELLKAWTHESIIGCQALRYAQVC